MKSIRFARQGSARRWPGTFAFFAMAVCCAASAACQIKVSNSDETGGSGDVSGGSAQTGNGGSSVAYGGTLGGGGTIASAAGGATSSNGNVGGSAATNREDCAHPDTIPNDDREHAVNFGTGATLCVLNTSDHDWFYVDTPSDGRAHVIQLDLTETDGAWVNFYVTAVNDGSDLGYIHPSQRGLKMSAFVTVGPGTRTLFDFYGFVANTDTVTVDVSVSAEADEHEPNNTLETATPIQPASEVSAALIMPYVSQTDQQIEDFYRVDVAAGKHTVKVTAVPSDAYPRFQVTDSTGALITTEHGPNRGATFSFPFTAAQAGTHYIRVDSFVDVDVLYSGTKSPSHSNPYKFQVD